MGDSILGNPIFSNGEPGIALTSCANRMQPAPELTSAQVAGGVTQVTGTLTARPLTTYQVEFFADPTGGPGNGQIFLGFAPVTTDAAGPPRFTISGLTDPNPAATNFVTATATSPAGDTSMFSQAINVSHAG